MIRVIENRFLICWALIICVMLLACAGFSFNNDKEPQIIIIRNRSQIGLTEFALKEAPRFGSGPVRHGAISPVPRGASQVYMRPSHAPPLPKTLVVEWIDDNGRHYTQAVSTGDVRRKSTGHPDEALVFEVYSGGEVLILLENLDRTK
jgi:hypothetical protein